MLKHLQVFGPFTMPFHRLPSQRGNRVTENQCQSVTLTESRATHSGHKPQAGTCCFAHHPLSRSCFPLVRSIRNSPQIAMKRRRTRRTSCGGSKGESVVARLWFRTSCVPHGTIPLVTCRMVHSDGFSFLNSLEKQI